MWRNEGPHFDCVFVVTAPPLLFSNNLPPATTMSSIPKTKFSQTSLSKAKANPPASSQTVVVIVVNNTIWRFGDQLSTMFMDPLVAIQTATQLLYKDADFLAHHHAFLVCQFTANSNCAAVFISLPNNEARCEYTADMYTNSNEAAVPVSSGSGNIFAL
ncbi:hypothetical protein PISMIDRAFT_101686 [Pisolithus microcarpus 441]|uniref:Uncharacterized protein n=1 Tax=Pisolithus microcarpus 441 TaxID=765257 RepID=A0A0C9ZKA9_9AGAM|nr:hypothetical protein PISMIDRAFT_101686 [Pisolithus microcarpus 441]